MAAVAAMAALVGTFLGWGLVTNATEGFGWLGYLLDPIGLGGREGGWAYANLGVLVAIVVVAAAPALAATLSVIGIHWEALKLWLKGIRIRRAPAPPEAKVTLGR